VTHHILPCLRKRALKIPAVVAELNGSHSRDVFMAGEMIFRRAVVSREVPEREAAAPNVTQP
jgi:hypothetical protein